MNATDVLRKRMHNLYLSRPCPELDVLAHELMGLHSWFYRNVPFSALIRGADIAGWKHGLTKTWLYRGTLHGVPYDDLPELLALHPNGSWLSDHFGREVADAFADEVVRYMEDGVYSRAEFRKIFRDRYDDDWLEMMFSPWGGIFVHLARQGRVAFRDMTSRDFDLISAEPTQTQADVLPGLLRRYFAAYGPATLADAAWFLGLWRDDAKALKRLPLDEYERFELNGATYYHIGPEPDTDIPHMTLLSGFDPLLSSYVDRSAALPQEHKAKVILKSGICVPTVALDGRVAGVWNIKKDQPVVEFFSEVPDRVRREAAERVERIIWRMK